LHMPRPAPSSYTLSLHDALPISQQLIGALFTDPGLLKAAGSALDDTERSLLERTGNEWTPADVPLLDEAAELLGDAGDTDAAARDRKSTRLNSSHVKISYAVFCL